MRNPRVVIPVLVALAVLTVVGVLALARGGTSAAPGGAGGGSAVPGSPAPASPVSPAPGPTGLPSPRAVTLLGWTGHGTTLRVSYATGLPSCSGQVLPPTVRESVSSVTVTLLREPPRHRRVRVCPDLAMIRTVEVHLQDPVGGRVVRDGGHGGAPVPEGGPAARTGGPLR